MLIEVKVTIEADEVREILAAAVAAKAGPPPVGCRYRCDLKSWGDAVISTESLPLPPSDPILCPAELPAQTPKDA
jgi:hypothetical protein